MLVRKFPRAHVRVKALAVALVGLFVVFAGLLSSPAPATAATTSNTLNFQARLLNNVGGIVPDGNYNIDFKIYTADSTTGSVGTCTGSCVWEETRTNAGGHGVPVTNGYFSVNLGSVTAFGAGINWDQQLWLTMNIGGVSTGTVTWDGEMQNSGHSIALTALPYAFTAGQLAKTSGANRGTLAFNTVANNPVITLPDETGTVCTTAAAGVCTVAGTGFVQLQTSLGTAQTGYFNISGTGEASIFQAGTIDTATSVALGIGTTHASEIDLNQNTVVAAGKSLQITGSGTRPGSPTAGMLYFDTSTSRLIQYTGSKWVSAPKSNTEIVAASNSPQAEKDAADFVATGSDDGTTINSALTALPSGGGSVYLMEGTYTLGSTSINVPNNTMLSGSGNSTILTYPNSMPSSTYYAITNSVTSTGTNITIQNLLVDGNKSGQTAGTFYGIYFNGVGSSTTAGGRIVGVTVQNIKNYGIFLSGSSQNTISNSSSNNNGIWGIVLGGTGSSYNTIMNNIADGNGNYGIYEAGTTPTYNTITGNMANNNSINGIYVYSATNSSVTGNIASGNTSYGIYLNGSTGNTVSGNTANANSNGISVAGGANNTVTGNTANSNTNAGIQAQSSTASDTISGNTATGDAYGVQVWGSSNITVTGNNLASNTSYGIYLVTATNSNISGNKLDGSGGSSHNNAIFVATTSTANSITNNDITDSACSSDCYAIYISDAGSTGNYFSGNHFGYITTTYINNPNAVAETFSNQELTNNGDASFRNASNSVMAFQVQNSAGSSIFNVDTTNGLVGTAATSTASTNSNALTIQTGNATGTTSNSGNLSIDVGTATGTAGTVSIGTGNASAVSIGRSGVVTTLSGNIDVSGSLALKNSSTNFSTTGTSNDVNFGNVSLVRLTGASAQTITGIANGRDGYLLTLFNAGSNPVTIANENTGSTTPADRVITGTGTDLTLPADNSVTLIYDATTSRWRVNGITTGANAIGTYSSSNHYSNGATISGNSLILGSADATHPGLIDTGAQTFDGAKTFNDTLVANNTHGNAIAQFSDNGSNVMTIGSTGLITLQPAANLTNGQTGLAQTLTVANATSSGAETAMSQSITVSNTTAGTTTAQSISIIDNSSSITNQNTGLSISLSGTNANRGDLGIDVSVSKGIGIRAVTTGPIGNSLRCNAVAVAVGVCAGDTAGSNAGAGVYGYTTSRASSNIYDPQGAGVYGLNDATGGSAGVTYAGVKGVTQQSAAAASTSIGVFGQAKAGSGATAYGGYFTLDSGSGTTAGAALYASNNSIAANILQLADNTTTVLNVADGGAATFENQINSAAGFQIQNAGASDLFNVDTQDNYVIDNGTADLGNQLQNPGFEATGTTDGTGWYTPSATQVITNSSANAHSGNNEMVVTGNSTTHAIYSKYYAVHPGDSIYAEGYVKNSAGATGDAGIFIEFDDAGKASTTYSNADTGLPGTSYAKKSIATTVPAGSYYLRVALSVKATASAGSFYFDDLYLKRVNQQAPLLISNVSSTAFQVQNASSQTVLGVDTSAGKIFSGLPNGASAIGFTLNTTNSYTTSGAKLLSVQNNGTEEFYVDKDGNVRMGGTLTAYDGSTGGTVNVGSSQLQLNSSGAAASIRNINGTSGSANLSIGAGAGSSTVKFNSTTGDGTGGVAFYSGGASPSQVAGIDSSGNYSGNGYINNAVVSTAAFQVQDASSHTFIQADTSGGNLYLGNTGLGTAIQIGNSNTASVTQTINIGNNTGLSSTTNIVVGSTVAGTTTLQSGGGVIISTLATGNNNTYLCRTTTTNIISTCSGQGAGASYTQGGNSFGTLTNNTALLGTNDGNSLQLRTAGVARATLDQSNNLYLGNADATGVNAAPNSFNVKGTGSATTGTAGGDISLYGGAGNTASTGSAGGNVNIYGGNAGGTGGNNNGGNISLVAGLNTGTGTAGGVSVKNAANSVTAFQVQTTGSGAVFIVNTSTPTVTVSGGTVFSANTYTSGSNSTITQSLVDNNTTISATATATNLTFTVPSPTSAVTGRLLYISNGGTNPFILNLGSSSFTLGSGSSATLLYVGSGWTDAGIDASTLQQGYTNSAGGTTPEIKLDSTRQTLNIQDADSTVGTDILDVNASNAGGGGLGTVLFGVGSTGATKVHTTGTGSATAFVVQNANNANFIDVDTTTAGNSVTIDTDTGAAGTIKIGNTTGHSQSVSIGLTASNANNSTVNIATNPNAGATNTITIGSNGNAANAVTIDAGGTGGINIGNTDVAHTINIANGGSTTAQTVNIGSNSSTGKVNIKAGGQGIILSSNGSTTGTVVQSVTANSTLAFQVQNLSGFDLMNVDTANNQVTLGSTSQALVNSQALKIYTGTGAAAVVDLVTPADSATNSLYYGANAGRALFGYDGVNANAAVRGIAGRGFEVQTNNSSNNAFSVNTNGDSSFKNYASSTTAFQVQDNGSNSYLLVNTAATSVTIANGNANVSVSVLCGGSGTCSFGSNTTDHATNIGSASGASLTTVAGGSSGILLNPNGSGNTGVLVKPTNNSTSAFSVQQASGSTPVFDVDTTNKRVGVNTASPGAALTVNSGVSNTSGLQFQQLTNTSPVSSSFSQLLGLDSSGNVGLSSAGISLTSPALAYWDGTSDPTTNSQSYPLATLSGNAAYDSAANGVRLTSATNNQSGSMTWNFSQVNFEETQFQFKAGGGTGADSTWFYSYADATPTTEYGAGFTKGYLIYFSEYHHCVGIAYGSYSDGNQCGSGGGANPLTSQKLYNIADNTFHNVDIQIRQNIITVRWDSKVILSYTDVYTRDLSSLNFGFGSRTGGSNNNHYIKGLLVTKLGTNASQYDVEDKSPLASNLTWDNANEYLGVGSYNPDSTLDVHGTTSFKTVVTSAGTVYQGSGNVTSCTTTGTSGYTASTTVTGSGTSFSTSGVIVGDTIVLPDGLKDTITAVNSNTSLTVSTSRLECAGAYKIIRTVFGTSGNTVQIGSSTTDAVPITLNLDNYNGSSDPSGTNGAMYYNSNMNSFRCYTGGSWSTCGGIWQTVIKTGDTARTTTTESADPDLQFSMASGGSYSIRCQLYWSSSNTTAGFKANYSGPASPTSVAIAHYGINAGTSGTGLVITTEGVNNGNTGTNQTYTSGTTNGAGYSTFNGEYNNGSNAGTWSINWARNGGSGTSTLRQGSYCDYASF